MKKLASGKIIIIAGPTASGKSALARKVADAFNVAIINADSMQLYADISILTARPTAEEEKVLPHRLYGVIPAQEACSAVRWRDMALVAIDHERAAGRTPVLVGGTGLYFRALLKGISPIPDIPAEVRQNARDTLMELGSVGLHGWLATHDPAIAARLNPGDSQRLVRAYEVFVATGKSLLDWQKLPPIDLPDFQSVVLMLEPAREALYAQCDSRFVEMVKAGAIEEVRALLAQKLDPELPAMKALGVPELTRVIRAEMPLEAAIAAAQQATRRYAKRQSTWFRHQLKADFVLKDSESLSPKIFSFIRQFLLT